MGQHNSLTFVLIRPCCCCYCAGGNSSYIRRRTCATVSKPTTVTARPQLTEADLQDPDLLGELGQVSGGVDFGTPTSTTPAGPTKAGGGGAGDYGDGGGRGDDDDDDDDDGVVEPDRESDDEMDEDIMAYGDHPQEEVGVESLCGMLVVFAR